MQTHETLKDYVTKKREWEGEKGEEKRLRGRERVGKREQRGEKLLTSLSVRTALRRGSPAPERQTDEGPVIDSKRKETSSQRQKLKGLVGFFSCHEGSRL